MEESFDYGEIRDQVVLDDLKAAGFICINNILNDIPDDTIVLSKLTLKSNEDKKVGIRFDSCDSMNIDSLKVSLDKKIIVLIPKEIMKRTE
jgi:hypothetical protein